MKTFGDDFKQDVAIDRFKLEEECETQPSIYGYYASQFAEAKSDAERAKSRYDLVLAEKDLSIRRNPPMDVKLTEASISALVTESSDVQLAKEAVLVANAKVNNLEAAIFALNQKKSQLDNLVQLWIKDYYNKKQVTTDDVADAIYARHNGGK